MLHLIYTIMEDTYIFILLTRHLITEKATQKGRFFISAKVVTTVPEPS